MVRNRSPALCNRTRLTRPVLPSLFIVCGLLTLLLLGNSAAGVPITINSDPAPAAVVARISVPGPALTPTSDFATGQVFAPLGSPPAIAIVSNPPDFGVKTVTTSTVSDLSVPLLTYDPASGNIYLPEVATGSGPSAGAENLTVISPESDSVIGSVRLANHTFGLDGVATFDPANGDLYVPLSGTQGEVSVVSGASNTLLKTLPVGSSPITPVYDNVSHDIYVINANSGNVTVISGSNNSIVATIPLNVPARSVLGNPTFDSSAQELYVPDGGTANFTVISTTSNQVLTTLSLPGASSPVYDWENGDLYFSEIGPGRVVVLSGSTGEVISTLTVGTAPFPPFLDPTDSSLYVVNGLSNNVSIISGATNRVNGSIPLCTGTCYTEPRPGIFDGATGDLYIPVSFTTPNYATYVGNYLEALGPVAPHSPSGFGILPGEIGAITAAGILVAGGLVVLWTRRSRKQAGGPERKS